ncbi:MAG: hypothetical protein ACP5I1_09670, partial [Candidatus Hinthialibacter sp.]
LFKMGDANSLYERLLECIENPSFLKTIQPDPAKVKTMEADAEWMMKTYETVRQTRSIKKS